MTYNADLIHFLPDAVSTMHCPFLLDFTSMRSSLFTNCHCFDSLYGQIGLSHDETKYIDLGIPGNSSLCQSNLITNGDFQHDTSPVFSCNFSCLLLILAADTTTVHGVEKNMLGQKKLIICFSGTLFLKMMRAGGFLFLIFLNEML